MAILNLTQHEATAEQVEAGVSPLHIIEGADEQPVDELRRLLTFDDLPSKEEIEHRAKCIAELAYWSEYLQNGYDDAEDITKVMIGGAPFLMGPLVDAIKEMGSLEPVFAFSKREVVEEAQEDGSIRKTAIFRHIGFVEA